MQWVSCGTSYKQVSRWWKMEEEQVQTRFLICTQRKPWGVLNIGVVQHYAKGKCGSVPTSVPPKYSCIGVVSLNILICLFLLAATLFFWLHTPIGLYLGWLFSCPDCGGRAEVSLRTLWAGHQQPQTFAGQWSDQQLAHGEISVSVTFVFHSRCFKEYDFSCTWRNTIPTSKTS